MGDNTIFTNDELNEVLMAKLDTIQAEFERMGADSLLNSTPENIADYLYHEYRVEPVSLVESDIAIDYEEREFTIQSPIARIKGSYQARGTVVVVIIPFKGDPLLLRHKPSELEPSLPVGRIHYTNKNEEGIILAEFRIVHSDDGKAIKNDIDQNLERIRRYIMRANRQAEGFNQSLPVYIDQLVGKRYDRLAKHRDIVESLGYRIWRSPDPVQFVPVERKSISIAKLPDRPHEPDPAINMQLYESILQDVFSMAVMMERSPTVFRHMEEEDLRNILICMLNTNYRGEVAGEVFNYTGKSDILIRKDDKSVFIAECLIWRGQQYLSGKIDQLLGYLTWRDTKCQ